MTSVPAPQPAQLRRWPRVTRKQRQEFLSCLCAGWSVSHAAERTGRHRSVLYRLRDADADFAQLWDEALAAGTEALIDEARRRAVEGVAEPVYQRGELVGQVQRYSDNLLMFLIKQRDPSFRENARLEVTGRDGGAIEVANDWTPTSWQDVRAFIAQHGLDEPNVIDGEAVETPELEEGGDS